MALNTKSFSDVVDTQVTAMQSVATAFLNFAVGTVLRAIVESVAAVVMWLQGMVLDVLKASRASTSTDDDLDSWFADFGFTRLAATYSVGVVTFSRYTTTSAALVPVGTQVETADGTQFFQVTADTSNPAYSPSQQGYVIPIGVASVSVPATATVVGSTGNITTGAIALLSQAVPGVDTVTNGAPFTGGSDKESDGAARTRFQSFILSLSSATEIAVAYAVASLQSNLTYTLTENYNYDGAYDYGFFYVVVDDGSGSPPDSLVTAVSAAVDVVRPFTSRFAVFPPVAIMVIVSMTVTVGNGYDPTTTKAAVAAAINSYINSLALGESLAYTRLAQIGYGASNGVVNIDNILLNEDTQSITANSHQVIKTNNITVN